MIEHWEANPTQVFFVSHLDHDRACEPRERNFLVLHQQMRSFFTRFDLFFESNKDISIYQRSKQKNSFFWYSSWFRKTEIHSNFNNNVFFFALLLSLPSSTICRWIRTNQWNFRTQVSVCDRLLCWVSFSMFFNGKENYVYYFVYFRGFLVFVASVYWTISRWQLLSHSRSSYCTTAEEVCSSHTELETPGFRTRYHLTNTLHFLDYCLLRKTKTTFFSVLSSLNRLTCRFRRSFLSLSGHKSKKSRVYAAWGWGHAGGYEKKLCSMTLFDSAINPRRIQS